MLQSDESPIIASTKIQRELDMLDIWHKKWKIEVNTEKSVHITFTLRKNDCLPVYINGSQIPKSNCVKYLGMHLDRSQWIQ